MHVFLNKTEWHERVFEQRSKRSSSSKKFFGFEGYSIVEHLKKKNYEGFEMNRNMVNIV